jgi:heat shock protein HslJ
MRNTLWLAISLFLINQSYSQTKLHGYWRLHKCINLINNIEIFHDLSPLPLIFTDKLYKGDDGCNFFEGYYELSKAEIKLNHPLSTKVLCHRKQRESADSLKKFFSKVTYHKITSDTLILTDKSTVKLIYLR